MAQISASGFLYDTSPTLSYFDYFREYPLTADTTPTFLGTSDANDVITVTGVRVGGNGVSIKETVSADVDGNWHFTPQPLSGGHWAFYADGSAGKTEVRDVYIDTQPPRAYFEVEQHPVTAREITCNLRFSDDSNGITYGGFPAYFRKPVVDPSAITLNEHGVSGSYISRNDGHVISVHVGTGAGSISLTLDADVSPLTDPVGYRLTIDTTSDAVSVGAEAVFRFYDIATSNHFYTTSSHEKAEIEANLPAFRFEGIQWGGHSVGGAQSRS